MVLTLALISLAAWIHLLTARGLFWQVASPPPPPETTSPSIAGIRVTAVIPARNEAEGIGATVASLLTQDLPQGVSVVVVDDHSADDTAGIARRTAEELGKADRLTVVSGTPLPAGWTGKLWAVSQGLAQVVPGSADFVLLTDGDITHARDNVATLVRRALGNRLDLVSLMVRLSTANALERWAIPAFVFFFFMLYPPRWAADPRNKLAAAAGGCMLVRPEALDRIGGIASIRGALIDDCALAAAIKNGGGRIRLDPAVATTSSRVYRDLGEIWSMIARTAFTQLRYSVLLLIGTLLGLAVTYLAPPLLALFAHGAPRWLGLAAWILMAAAFAPTLRLYGLGIWRAVFLPVIAAFYAAATFGSALDYWRGKGGRWKGRAQALPKILPPKAG